MSFLRGIEEELVRGDLEVFHEFDASHFISNAKSAITGKAETVNLKIKLTHYGDMVEKAMNNFVNIKLDKNALRTFVELSKDVNIENASIFVNGLEDVNDIMLRPQYLDQYTKIVMEAMDKVSKGEITSESEIVQMLMGNMPMKVQKQVVRTSLPYGVTTKSLIKTSTNKLVKVDNKYVSTVALPFVEKYDTLKDEVTTEVSNTLAAIRETSEKVTAMVKVMNNIKTSQSNLPVERLRLLDQVYYNAARGIIEVISFVSFMCIRKMNMMSSNVVSCNKLYTDMMNFYSSGKHREHLTSEAVTDDRFVTNLDNASMADELIKGHVDAFHALANNIYELHMGIPKVNVGVTPDNVDDYEEPGQTTVDVMMDEQEYDDEIYQDIAKTYIEISNGIDRLARRSDDYMMIFDDIINYAGFTLRLEDRFRNEINKIEDLSLYRGALNISGGNPNTEVYKRMLAEVKAFPDNMQKIADNALETITKINALNDRYINNINGEFKDLETVNELKIFMKDLIVQYRAYSEIVVSKMMLRLKEIGEMITELSSIIYGEREPEISTYPVPTDVINYTESVFDSIVEEIEQQNARIFESLQLEYYTEKERALKGVNVVFEDENASQPTQTTANTKVTIQDNNVENKQTPSQANISKIGEWFRNVIEQFMNMFNKESKKNADWLRNNKEGLLNRSYNNVTINILPYKNVAPEVITGDIGKLTNIINGLSPAVVAGFKTKEDMYKKVFPFIQGGVNTANPLKDQFVKYYKVGSAELAVGPIANGELKSEITSVIIPYCESYYNGYINDVQNGLNTLTSAVDSLCDKFASGTTTESVSIFEADENQNASKEPSMTEKAAWLKEGIKYFEGSILNAVRDRKNDYFKVLSSLAPKAPVKPTQPVDVKPDQPTNNTQATEPQPQA